MVGAQRNVQVGAQSDAQIGAELQKCSLSTTNTYGNSYLSHLLGHTA